MPIAGLVAILPHRSASRGRGSKIAWCGDARRQPVGSLGFELGETAFGRPVGFTQFVVLGEPALTDRLVEGAERFDVLFQFPELTFQILFALIKGGEQAFDGSAGRGLHKLFQG